MRKIVKYGALVLLLGVIMLSASAQLGGNLTVSDSEPATVNVTISSRIMVDITPASFSWSAANPGTVADYTTEANGYPAIQIENIGSTNITHVWFNATYPASRPYGTGSTSVQNAGNYIVLSKNMTTTRYWGINQLEYNETTTLYYIKDMAGNMPPSATHTYGRYHNASGEYFWMISKSSACADGTAVLRIGNVSHSKTQTGTTNFQTGAFTSWTLADIGDASYGYVDITAGPLAGLCVAVSSDCRRVFFSKWNADEPFQRCANVGYAWDSAVDGRLVPGDSFAMGIKANIPYGVAAGATTGKIWAIVNSI
jgi:hypothetical protein